MIVAQLFHLSNIQFHMLVRLYVNCSVGYCLYFSISLIDRQCREYLEHILEYLTSFLYRIEPLQDVDKIF
jgi:hypothetical protein